MSFIERSVRNETQKEIKSEDFMEEEYYQVTPKPLPQSIRPKDIPF